ncbi:hypothetical protein VTN77DRAFT_8721 [Rasamsonia byssochlamydoides]|uniref:uncharacterized protein n=1 Tax=Rasamsonia byssochlamydoides TaxID=89139 RepID=UPI0037428FCA
MSSGIKMEPGNVVSLPQTSAQSVNQSSRPRHTPSIQDISTMSSRTVQDDDISSQDRFSLSSTSLQRQPSQDMDRWTISTSDSMESSPIASTQPETPEIQMLSYSFSHHLMPTGAGHNGVNDSAAMFPALSDLQAAQSMGEHNEFDMSQAQDFQAFSSMVDFAFDNDSYTSEGNQGCMHDDTASLGQSSHNDDGHLVAAHDIWKSLSLDTGNYPGSTFDQLQSHGLPGPASPPLTETSQVSVTSACSQSAYSFRGHDDTLLGENNANSTVCGQNLSLGDPFFPLTPPLNDQDPNRTIRPSKQAQRPLLSAAQVRSQRKSDPEVYTSLSVREPLRQRSKDTSEVRAPRDHPYYSLPTHSDGKYYCPFSTGENPCNHPPTTQKCAYHKYLDSHLKPYRCKVPACMAQKLHFSSNACLFRHEREAHGFHGHGDNPHLCLFEGCDRSIPGYGFPRRWNLYDHMKRVHDYTSSDQPSSPENNSAGGQASKKKDSVRKRKVTKTTTIGAQTMKRTRSTSSQGNGSKATHASANYSQRLQNAEKNYYNCRARLLEELSNITPQDSAMHEKVNASLQELITLGLNYRQLEASSAATQMAGGLSA